MKWFRSIAVSAALMASSSVLLASQAAAPQVSVDPSIADTAPFPTRLIASRSPTNDEWLALSSLLGSYRSLSQEQGLRLIEAYLARSPESPWAMALHLNMGSLYYQSGYFGAAIDAFDKARNVRGSSDSAAIRLIRDAATGELARMHARLGHADALESLLGEIGGRPMLGSASEAVAGAREGLYQMRHNPEVAYTCGPAALASLVMAARESGSESSAKLAAVSEESLHEIRQYPSGKNGIRMAEVLALSESAGMNLVAAWRPAGASLPLPAVVHWKVDHYAAVIDKRNGLYQVRDPTFGKDLWISEAALDSESSGLFLVTREAAAGWVAASSQVLNETIGRGYVTSFDQDDTRSDSVLEEDQACPRGMCVPNVVSMLNSLRLSDVPVGYSPSFGPSVFTRLTYNQRESSQPAAFAYASLGPKWSMNWTSFIEDNPASAGANTRRIDGGGGSLAYAGYSTLSKAFQRERRTGAQLVLTSTNPVVYERRMRDGAREVFSASDGSTSYPRRIFLTKIIDPQGNALELSYDSTNRLRTIADPVGRVTNFYYQHPSDPFLVTGVTDPFNRSAFFDYDGNGRLERITDTIGISSTFSYDASTRIISLQTPYGITSFESGSTPTQRWLEITDPMGGTRRSEFIANTPGHVQSEPVPDGIEAFQYLHYRNTHYWDAEAWNRHPADYTQSSVKHWLHGIPSTVLEGVLESTKEPLESRIWYTNQGQRQPGFINGSTLDMPSSTARMLPGSVSQLTTRKYTLSGNLSEEIDPMGRKIQYDHFGALLNPKLVRAVVNNQYVHLASYTYNAKNRPLTFKDAAGQTWTMAWNSQGQLTTFTNPLGEKTTRTYNALGQMIRVSGPANQTIYSATYDSVGRIASETDAGGYLVAYSYDALDRIIKTSYPDGTDEINTWTALDLTAVKDRMGRLTTYEYNANRMLVEKIEPGGHVSNYEYDLANRIIAFTDPRGVTTRWERDVQGRVTAEIFSDNTRRTYVYDIAGRLDRTTDVLGQVRQYAYSKDDRLVGISYPNALHATPSVNFNWDTYRPRLTSMTDGVSSTSYQYHPEGTLGGGKLASETSSLGPTANLNFQYDALGRIRSRSVGGSDEIYSYDSLGRVASVENVLGTHAKSYLGNTTQLTQSAAGLIQSGFSYGSNLNDRHLSGVSTDSGAGFVGAFAYQRDVLGRLAIADETRSIATNPAILRTQEFLYDPHDRLVSRSDSSTSAYSESFSYDDSGNLITQTRGSTSWNATANADNQLTSADGVAWEYDLVGNLVKDSKNLYKWDAESRLVQIQNTVTGALSIFSYDGLGRRVKAVEQATATATPSTTYFLWCESEICQRRDADQSISATYFTEGEVHGPEKLFYHRDQLGSIREVLNVEGEVVGSMNYGAYGNRTSGTGIMTDKRYAGMFFHNSSGLYLTWYRAYSPHSGRWISRDPVGLEGSVNLYAYVDGDPINAVDPLGLWELPALPQPVVDVAAGFGDGVSSALTFGLYSTADARESLGIDGGVDYCSASYGTAEVAGQVQGALSGVGGAAKGLARLSNFRQFRFLNQNRYMRFGPGKPGRGMQKVDMVRIGPSPWNIATPSRAWWTHWRL